MHGGRSILLIFMARTNRRSRRIFRTSLQPGALHWLGSQAALSSVSHPTEPSAVDARR